MEFCFKDKCVLVTGASKGLGNVVARAFAAHGAKVFFTGRTEEKLSRLKDELENSHLHGFFVGDLTEKGQIEKLIDEAQKCLEKFDIVFHALGGGYGFRDPLLSMEQFSLLHQVNVGVGAEINRLIVPMMQKQRWGRIIHVGSVTSTDAIASVGYNTVKASLTAYVKSIGRCFAKDNVVATAINPGAFYAPGNSWVRLEERDPQVVQDFVESRLPRGYIAKAEEMLGLIFLLASEEASMMGGTSVAIDAGESVAYSQD